MNYLKYSCGIDMAKEKFDACLGAMSIEKGYQKLSTAQFANTLTGFEQYFRWIKKHCRQSSLPLVHLLEATGIYYESLAMFLAVRKLQFVSVILPNKAKKYKESLGFKSKTDSTDALALGTMACEQTLKKWNAPNEKMYELRGITRQIESLTGQSTAAKNQLEAVSHGAFVIKQIKKSLEKQIRFLNSQKAELIRSLEQLVDTDASLKAMFANILKIKGLGLLAVATIIAETGGFELFESAAQLVSYAGYDVVENQSGKHTGKTKISKKGNGRIRRVLHFPALNMVRYQVYPFLQLYERVYERSKIKMKGYTAVQKKLLIIIYTLWKKNEPFIERHKEDKTSGEMEKEPALVSASQKQYRKKVASATAEATQDKHPSKHRSMPSLV